MAKQPKVHKSQGHRAVCGVLYAETARFWKKVTCKRCLRQKPE